MENDNFSELYELKSLYKCKDFEMMPLFAKQIEALLFLEDDTTNEVLYGGSARSGKSLLGCDWQIFRRLTMPESYSLVGREELTKLKDTTLLTFFQRLKYYGLQKDIDYRYNAQDFKFEFPNGSRVFFREIKYIPSDPEFDRLGSYDLTDAFIDEAQQVHYKAPQVLKGRFSITQGEGWQTIPKVLYTCNPAKTWIYTDFVKPSMTGNISARKKFVAALPSDNPYVPQSFFDNLATADEVTKQRLLYGNFEYDDDPSALVDYDALLDLFTNSQAKSGVKRISADLAMQGRDKFIAGSWDGMRCTVSIDMKKSTAKEIEDSLVKLKTEKGVGNTNIIADSDGLGAYLSAYINNIVTFHGGSSAVNKKEFGNIKDECGFKLAEKIQNREILIICSKAQEEEIRKEISICLKRDNVDTDKKKLIKKEKMKELLGRSPDYLDMLLMRMWFEIKEESYIY
jgi:hypothetical protein